MFIRFFRHLEIKKLFKAVAEVEELKKIALV